MPEWFYAKNGATFGPVTMEALRKLAEAGEIKGDDHAWKVGMPDWIAVSLVEGLLPNNTSKRPPPIPSLPPPLPASPPPLRKGKRISFTPFKERKHVTILVAVLVLVALMLSTMQGSERTEGNDDSECEGNSGGGAMMFVPHCWVVAMTHGGSQAQYDPQRIEKDNKEIAAYSARLKSELAAMTPPVTYADHNNGTAPPVFLSDDSDMLSLQSCTSHDSLVSCTLRSNRQGPISMSSYHAKCLTGSGRLLVQAPLAGVLQGAIPAEISIIRTPDLTARIVIERNS